LSTVGGVRNPRITVNPFARPSTCHVPRPRGPAGECPGPSSVCHYLRASDQTPRVRPRRAPQHAQAPQYAQASPRAGVLAAPDRPRKTPCARLDRPRDGRSLPFCLRTRDNRATERNSCGWPVSPQAPRVAAYPEPGRARCRSGRGAWSAEEGDGQWRR
jgi:hypothetical protein